MNRSNHTSVVRLTSLALLAALVVVLQTVASGIRIGPVPISLTLVPIVVGGSWSWRGIRDRLPDRRHYGHR